MPRKVFHATASVELKLAICKAIGITPEQCSDLQIHIPVSGPITATAELLLEADMVPYVVEEMKPLEWKDGPIALGALEMWDKIPFPKELRHSFDVAGQAFYTVQDDFLNTPKLVIGQKN